MSTSSSGFNGGNEYAVQVATVLLPGLRDALGLVPLDISVWTVTAVAIAVTWALAEGTTLVLNRFLFRPGLLGRAL